MASHGHGLDADTARDANLAHEEELDWADADLVEVSPAQEKEPLGGPPTELRSAPARVSGAGPLPLEIPGRGSAPARPPVAGAVSSDTGWAWGDEDDGPQANPVPRSREALALDLPPHAPGAHLGHAPTPAATFAPMPAAAPPRLDAGPSRPQAAKAAPTAAPPVPAAVPPPAMIAEAPPDDDIALLSEDLLFPEVDPLADDIFDTPAFERRPSRGARQREATPPLDAAAHHASTAQPVAGDKQHELSHAQVSPHEENDITALEEDTDDDLATVPLTRVPFSSPLLLQRDDEEDAYEGRVINLSEDGLAGSLTASLEVGEQIWASFGLGPTPVTALSRVTWKGDDGSTYGFSFERISERDRARLQDVVALHGAGPDDATTAGRTLSPWLAGGIGMAVGILLTVAVNVFLSPTEGEAAPPVVASAFGEAAPAGDAAEAGPAGESAQADAPAAPAPEAKAAPEAAAVPAGSDAKAAPQEAAAPEPAAPKGTTAPSLLPSKASPEPSVPSDQILRPMGGPDTMPLALLCDGPVDQHITFWLSSPRRLVIDVPNRKSGFKRTQYEVDHPLAKRLRVGNHPGKVRFVLETSEDVAPEVYTTARGNSLAIELRRK